MITGYFLVVSDNYRVYTCWAYPKICQIEQQVLSNVLTITLEKVYYKLQGIF